MRGLDGFSNIYMPPLMNPTANKWRGFGPFGAIALVGEMGRRLVLRLHPVPLTWPVPVAQTLRHDSLEAALADRCEECLAVFERRDETDGRPSLKFELLEQDKMCAAGDFGEADLNCSTRRTDRRTVERRPPAARGAGQGKCLSPWAPARPS
jgi:hypothetical protein